MKNRLKQVEPIDLTTWELGDDEADAILKSALKGAALEGARQVLQIAIDERASIYFPWEWGGSDGLSGPRPAHPMVAYVELPLGPDVFEPAKWSVDLKEVVATLIDNHQQMTTPGKVTDPDSRTLLRQIADGFRGLAATLDNAISPDASEDPARPLPAVAPPASDDDTPRR